jgi:hypothetical protein
MLKRSGPLHLSERIRQVLQERGLPSLPIVGETRETEELVMRVEKELSP